MVVLALLAMMLAKPACAAIQAYEAMGPKWLLLRAKATPTPVSRAAAIAASSARVPTRVPMPLSPSTMAMAGDFFSTRIAALALMPPIFSRSP